MTIKKHIPNSITSLNLLCGVLGIVFTFKGRFDIAFPLMLCASVFDFCDGLSARLLGAYSEKGKELDSLADMVSFGVLPSVMLFKLMVQCNFSESIWCYFPLLIAVGSALRLAKFNVDDRQHESFLGLPTPACAMICGSLCYFVAYEPVNIISIWCAGIVFLPLISVILAVLLVCEIPMFSMKFGKKKAESAVFKKRIAFLVNSLLILAVVLLLDLNWSLVILLIFVFYVLMNLGYAIAKV